MGIQLLDYLRGKSSGKKSGAVELDWAYIRGELINGHKKINWFSPNTMEPCYIFKKAALAECAKLKILDQVIFTILDSAPGKIIQREAPAIMVGAEIKGETVALDTFFEGIVKLKIDKTSNFLGDILEAAHCNGFTETSLILASKIKEYVLGHIADPKAIEKIQKLFVSAAKSGTLYKIIEDLVAQGANLTPLSLQQNQELLNIIKNDSEGIVTKFVDSEHGKNCADFNAKISYYATEYLNTGKMQKVEFTTLQEKNLKDGVAHAAAADAGDEHKAIKTLDTFNSGNLGINSTSLGAKPLHPINNSENKAAQSIEEFVKFLISKLKTSGALQEFRQENFSTDENQEDFDPKIYDQYDLELLFYALVQQEEYLQKTFIPKRATEKGVSYTYEDVFKNFIGTLDIRALTTEVGYHGGGDRMTMLEFVSDEVKFFKAIFERGLELEHFSKTGFESICKQVLSENAPEVVQYLLTSPDKIEFTWAEALKHAANYGCTNAFQMYVASNAAIISDKFGREGSVPADGVAKYTILNLLLDSLSKQVASMNTKAVQSDFEQLEAWLENANKRIECINILHKAQKIYYNAPENEHQVSIAQRTLGFLTTIQKETIKIGDYISSATGLPEALKAGLISLISASVEFNTTITDAYGSIKGLDPSIASFIAAHNDGEALSMAETMLSAFEGLRDAPDGNIGEAADAPVDDYQAAVWAELDNQTMLAGDTYE